MTVLKNAIDKQKDLLIDYLLKNGFTKLSDGRQLYELTLTELEQLHVKEECC